MENPQELVNIVTITIMNIAFFVILFKWVLPDILEWTLPALGKPLKRR